MFLIHITTIFASTDYWLRTNKDMIVIFDNDICNIPNSIKIKRQTFVVNDGNIENCSNQLFISPIWQTDGVEIAIANQIILYDYDVIEINKVMALLDSYEILDVDSHKFEFGIYYDITIKCLSYEDILDICQTIKKANVCNIVEPHYITFDKSLIEPWYSNPYYSNQWGLNNSLYAHNDINAPEAWHNSIGTNTVIAVNDDGVDLDHYDLVDNLLFGYDFTDGVKNGINGGYGQINDSTCVDNHGTLCSGIIVAMHNSIGLIGVSHDAKLLPARIMYSMDPTNPSVHIGSSIWKRNAFLIETMLGVDVTSNSWSTAKSTIIDTTMYSSITHGRNGKGCVNVCASGNENNSVLSYPASSPYTIAVGAIDKYGNRASFSNYGNGLDVVAPGVNIFTTDVNDQYDNPNGTSMACPFVAAVAALMLSVNPDLTWQEVRSIIR